jgi:type II secretory pathway component PulC
LGELVGYRPWPRHDVSVLYTVGMKDGDENLKETGAKLIITRKI